MKFEIFSYHGQLLAVDEPGTFYKLIPLSQEIATKVCEVSTDPPTPKEVITNLLIESCIPQDIKGFTFIQEAFCFLKDNPESSCKLLENVYGYVAKKHNSTIGRVERAIRHALSIAIIPDKYVFLKDVKKPKSFLMTCVNCL